MVVLCANVYCPFPSKGEPLLKTTSLKLFLYGLYATDYWQDNQYIPLLLSFYAPDSNLPILPNNF